MKYRRQSCRVAALAIVLALIGPTAGLTALQTTGANPAAVSPQPLVAGVQTFGATYGEWSARWWQWLLSIPAAQNPNLDQSGADCKEGQTGNVWFLAGTFGEGPVTRTCTVPAGKGIFFPVVNSITFAPFPHETLNALRAQAADFLDAVTLLKVTLDGVDLPDLRSLRVQSPVFSFTVPEAGVLPSGFCPLLAGPPSPTPPPRGPSQFCDPAVADGFWVLLSPLRPGGHKLRFRAKANTDPPFALDVTYNLTIAP
jgi:hypothetical protein